MQKRSMLDENDSDTLQLLDELNSDWAWLWKKKLKKRESPGDELHCSAQARKGMCHTDCTPHSRHIYGKPIE